MDTVSQACVEVGTFPHASSPIHTRYTLAGPSYQLRGTGPCQLYQHRVHAPQGPTPMGGACHPYGGVPDAQAPDVWRAPACQAKPGSPQAEIQRHCESKPPVAPHQAQGIGRACNGQTSMESLNTQSCVQL